MTRAHHSYDVFLSLGGPDRIEVRALKRELERIGLTAFLDEHDIRYFTGITAEIEQALSGSRVLVAYYSAAYPERSACQFELTAAYLAAQREGDPTRRIIVVNPEPGEDHIQPVELVDARFAVRPGNRADLEELARSIKRRVNEIDGSFDQIAFTERPGWYTARVPGVAGFVGRYRELWALHSALNAIDYPLTQVRGCGPVASLTGLPGIGKSSLAAAYAWQFGAAFRGGVYWIDLAGTETGADVLAHYADKVRLLAQSVGLPVEGVDRARLFGLVGDHLAAAPEPSLWVIDDIPPEVDPELAHDLVVPGGSAVRTILISTRARFHDLVPFVELDALSADDACSLLRSYREPENPAEQRAMARLAEWLGRHPQALQLAGRHLKSRRDLLSYAQYLSTLQADTRTTGVFGALVGEAVSGLDPTQRLVLRIADQCGAGPVPTALLHRIADRLDYSPPSAGSVAAALGDALDGLRERLLATENDGLWTISRIVRVAVADIGPDSRLDPITTQLVPGLVADCLLELSAEGCRPSVAVELVAHARSLADRDELDTDRVIALLRLIAAHYESCGEAGCAAGYRERVLAYAPDSLPDLLRAAADHQAVGSYEAGADLANRARFLAADDPTSRLRADLILASSLDGMTRYSEADQVWTLIGFPIDASLGLSEAERLAADVARLHAMALRSELRPAIQQARELIGSCETTSDAATADELQNARLELARMLLLTGDQREARDVAGQVVEFYRARRLPQHFRHLQAQEVQAETQLTVAFREWRVDAHARERAEESIRQLWQSSVRDHGELSPFALSAAVGFGYALTTQGKYEQAREHLSKTRADIARRFGPLSPLYLRATFLLGWTLRHFKQDQAAMDAFQAAFDGQRTVLGPRHPHTLHSEYELGMTMQFLDRNAEGRALIDEVRRLLPDNVGYDALVRSQADIGALYARLPPIILKVLRWFT